MTDAKSQARADRLKAALRENLKRRKVQARGREATDRSDVAGRAEQPESRNRTEE
jgi:hypothetical protein